MKHVKLISILLAMVLFIGLASAVPVFAASASATLTGPSTVRAGDTITLTFAVNGSGLYGVEGALSYDSSQVTLSSVSQKISSKWSLSTNGDKFTAYDTQMSAPISKSTSLFTATFKVKSSVKTGANITISVKNIVATDGSNSINASTASYSKTVAAPKSTDATLKAMTVSNATISPAFDTNTTKYTASVDFSVSKLNVTATATDSKAKVAISGNDLKVGSNTVKVTVTAENGSKKEYTITVTRAQDPNYVASNNANLKEITINQGILSPAFKADQTEYVVYLPYEVTKFNASGTTADSKASAAATGDVALEVGENKVTVVATAEDGSKKEYHITVMRMPQLGAEEGPQDPGTTQEPSATDEPTATPDATEAPEATQTPDNQQPTQESGIPMWIWIVLLVVAFGAGFGIGMLLKKK